MRSEHSFSPAVIAGLMLLAAVGGPIAAPAALAHNAPIPIPESRGVAAAAHSVSVINKPGSYVLTRNITAKKPGMDGVDVNASNVTIDLQGFTISGVSGSGVGVNAIGQNQVTIENGIITQMGGPAVIVGAQSTVTRITATGDSSSGGTTPVIQAGNGSSLVGNTVGNGGSAGIGCALSCLARDNLLQNNTGSGLIFSDASSGYAGNVLSGNGGSSQVSGGTQIGQNLCNGALCP